NMLLQSTGGDATRGLGGASAIFFYTTATLADWVSSIPWSKDFIPPERASGLHHEINYSVGPILLLLLMPALRGHKCLVMGTIVSLIMAMLFSMNVAPFSTLLPEIVSPLKSFRVPERAILPGIMAVIVLACCGVSTLSAQTQWQGRALSQGQTWAFLGGIVA